MGNLWAVITPSLYSILRASLYTTWLTEKSRYPIQWPTDWLTDFGFNNKKRRIITQKKTRLGHVPRPAWDPTKNWMQFLMLLRFFHLKQQLQKRSLIVCITLIPLLRTEHAIYPRLETNENYSRLVVVLFPSTWWTNFPSLLLEL